MHFSLICRSSYIGRSISAEFVLYHLGRIGRIKANQVILMFNYFATPLSFIVACNGFLRELYELLRAAALRYSNTAEQQYRNNNVI